MAYKLDGDLLVVQQVCTFEDHTERPLSNLLANTIMYTNNIGRRGGHRGRGFEEESRCEENVISTIKADVPVRADQRCRSRF